MAVSGVLRISKVVAVVVVVVFNTFNWSVLLLSAVPLFTFQFEYVIMTRFFFLYALFLCLLNTALCVPWHTPLMGRHGTDHAVFVHAR